MIAVEIKGKVFKSLEELQKQFFASEATKFWAYPAPPSLRHPFGRPKRKVCIWDAEYTWGYMVFKNLTELKPYEGSEWRYLVANTPAECRIVMV